MLVFGLVFSANGQRSEDLKVTQVTRLTHPAFRSENSFIAHDWRAWNRDHTRMMLYEAPNSYTTEYGSHTGRGLVWGFVDELKSWTTLEEYKAAARPIPDAIQITNWKWAPNWSPFPGEENIMYAPWGVGGKVLLRKINVDNGQTTDVMDLTISGCNTMVTYNWAKDLKLIASCSFQSFTGGGWEIDVQAGTKRSLGTGTLKYVPSRCTDEWKNFPDYYQNGHGSISPSGNRWANNYGSGHGVNRGVGDCSNNEITLDTNNGPVHVSWKASENWFLASDCGPCSWVTNPNIGDYSLYQIYFDGSTFTHRKLFSMPSASRWKDGNEQVYNFGAIAIATLSRNGRMAVFMSTDGKYSWEDNQKRGVTPWGLEGVFLAEMALVSGQGLNPGDINYDDKVDVNDIIEIILKFGLRKDQTGFDARADQNTDDIINIQDLIFVITHFGTQY